jgi:hypothetical protein
MLPVNIFRKSAHCPASQTLLEYRHNEVTLSQKAWVEAHLDYCDFCDAELHLLDHYRDEPEESVPGQIPPALRQLAEILLPHVMRPRLVMRASQRPRAVS